MQIDVTKLLTGNIDSLNIQGSVDIPKKMLSNSRIDELKDIKIDGNIYLNENNELVLEGILSGTMVLKDDLTLEPVDYEFKTDFEEILNKSENILDITDILWQNILVEIPSKVRTTSEDINLSGDGWRLISEEEYEKEKNKSNNPFSNLDELLKTKEDE